MKVRKKWLRLEDYEFKEMIDTYRLGLLECSYDEAHNWIFGAPAPPTFPSSPHTFSSFFRNFAARNKK